VNTSKPSGFTPDELAQASEAPLGDAELDGLEAADIDERPAPEPEEPFERLVQKAKKLSAERVRAIVESLLFVSDRPLNVDQLHQASGIAPSAIEAALGKLAAAHPEGQGGIVLHEVGGGWQFRTDPGSAEYVRRFLKVKPQRLTRAAVETLAIIAYRQPVTRPEVEDIRGVDCGAVVKALLDRRLIKILGKKEEPGRPMVYGTTREFLEFFALKDLASLPTLREFQELTREHLDIVEKEAPEVPKVEGTVAALADPSFLTRIEESSEASEAALAELETAMTDAESRAKAAHDVLEPKPPPVAEG
jgi:segregation and condensation protein B